MRKWVWMVLIAVAFMGCQKKHPVKLYIDESMRGETVEQIAVFPFTTALHEGEDPDRLAPTMLEQLFLPELDARNDYNFIAPNSVSYAIQRIERGEQAERFLGEWPKTRKADMGLLSPLAQALDCDAFLIPSVDLWQKDEADYQEDATPATYVGATITIVSAETGKVLFQAIDEDYMEGARTETSDRTVVRSPSGFVYSDMGSRVHRAPPFEEVARKVVRALVASLPVR